MHFLMFRNRLLVCILNICKDAMGHLPKVVGIDIVELALWAKVRMCFPSPIVYVDIFLSLKVWLILWHLCYVAAVTTHTLYLIKFNILHYNLSSLTHDREKRRNTMASGSNMISGLKFTPLAIGSI